MVDEIMMLLLLSKPEVPRVCSGAQGYYLFGLLGISGVEEIEEGVDQDIESGCPCVSS